jgi:hypothetical protein
MIGKRGREAKRGTLNITKVRRFETPSGAQAIELKIEVSNKLAAYNIKCLCNMMDSMKKINSTEELNDTLMSICGYVLCCENSSFISGQAEEELVSMAIMMAEAQANIIEGVKGRRSIAFMAYEQREGFSNGGKKVMRQE